MVNATRWASTLRLKARLNAIPEYVREEVRKTLNREGRSLARKIKAVVPIDGGELRDSVRTKDITNSLRVAVVVTEGDDRQFYARFVEFGDGFSGIAQPHFFPTYRANKRKIARAKKAAARRAIRKAAAK